MEGSRGSRIAQNPLPPSNWTRRRGVQARPRQSVCSVALGAAPCSVASYSFPYFTGLCEKAAYVAASLMLSAGRDK